ncbi:MAG: hypothetical protein ABIX01_19140 [Chitinophagaceae bacterium]
MIAPLLISLSTFYVPGAIFIAGFAVGYFIQNARVNLYREKQLRAEKEKLKMQAEMLGMGHYYDNK